MKDTVFNMKQRNIKRYFFYETILDDYYYLRTHQSFMFCTVLATEYTFIILL